MNATIKEWYEMNVRFRWDIVHQNPGISVSEAGICISNQNGEWIGFARKERQRKHDYNYRIGPFKSLEKCQLDVEKRFLVI